MDDNKSVCEQGLFEQVFNTYSKTIRNFIYYKCGNLDQADDLVQDAFVKLWNNCAKVPFSKAKSFLYTVANNAFLNEVAHQKVKLKHQKALVNNVDYENPEFKYREKEFQEELNKAIANLSEKQREVFLLNRLLRNISVVMIIQSASGLNFISPVMIPKEISGNFLVVEKKFNFVMLLKLEFISNCMTFSRIFFCAAF